MPILTGIFVFIASAIAWSWAGDDTSRYWTVMRWHGAFLALMVVLGVWFLRETLLSVIRRYR